MTAPPEPSRTTPARASPNDPPVWGRSAAPWEAKVDGLGDFVIDVASTEVDGFDDGDRHELDGDALALEDPLADVLPEAEGDAEHPPGDLLALEVAETLVEVDGDGEHWLDGDPLALEVAETLVVDDGDGEHSLGLEDSLGVTLTDDDGVTLGLVDEQTSVWTVCTYGAMPPDVIDPTTV